MTKTPIEIEISKLHPFENHPFQVKDDENMDLLMTSIKENGVLSPIIVRPKENTADEYEIVSGHRRFRAVQRLGYKTIPAFVYELDRDSAAVAVVDSNLHRECLLPSEKAFAYKMKLDALKHQGKATNETSRQLVGKSETADIIFETESGRQVQRYIRLTNLIPSLLRYVDEGKIALTPAVALSYLYPYEQAILVEAMEYYDCTPSLSQALYLKGISQAGVLDETEVYKVMSEEKANQKEHIRFSKDELRRFFPGGYSSKQMSDAIIKMLEARQRARENKGGDAR